jgi:hypothetical protein
METRIYKTLCMLILGGSLAGAATTAIAEITVTGGTMVCSGNHTDRQTASGIEQHATIVRLYNYHDTATVNIQRFRLYDSNGTMLLEWDAANPVPLPPDLKTALGPRQATNVRSPEILPPNGIVVPRQNQPLHIQVDWSVADGQRGYALRGTAIDRVRDAASGREQSRSDHECENIKLTWR